MATLLANPKMHPALAARIEASVTGRRKQALKIRSTARLVSWVRVGIALGLAALVGSIVVTRQRERAALLRSRTALLELWSSYSSAIAKSDLERLPSMERLLAEAAKSYPGDVFAVGLQTQEGLASTLARPTVYIRGPLAAMVDSASIGRAATESGKDALLLCLCRPPDGNTEKQLLPTARLALGRGAPVEELTPNVRRFADLTVGLPYLLPHWGDLIRDAKDQPEILRLDRELRRAPIKAAKSALAAQVLVAALDEPNEAGGVTELDGEHTHFIRLEIIELASSKALLRFRKQVDPSWITANRRSQYARELDGCRFALELYEAVRNLGQSMKPPPASTAGR